jgi:hypothetical protein
MGSKISDSLWIVEANLIIPNRFHGRGPRSFDLAAMQIQSANSRYFEEVACAQRGTAAHLWRVQRASVAYCLVSLIIGQLTITAEKRFGTEHVATI